MKHNIKHAATASCRFLREKEVLAEFFPVSPATLWRRVRSGHFPAPRRLGPGVTAWDRADLEAWAAGCGGEK